MPIRFVRLGVVCLSFLGASALAAAQQPSPEQMAQMQAMMQRQMQQQMQIMAVMFEVRPSRLGLDETLAAVRSGAAKRGWSVGEAQDMQARMQQAGVSQAKRMKILQVCPAHANERVARASNGKAPPLTCRVTVYEGTDGKSYLVRMNTGNMARLVQDAAVARVLAEIGTEEDALYREILQ